MVKAKDSVRLKKIYPLWLTAPSLIIYTLFTIAPVFIGLFYSFTDWNINRMAEPVFRGLENYGRIFKDTIFLKSMLNTFIYAFSTTILKTVVGLMLAVALIKKIPLNSLFRTLFYMPCVMSATIVGILFRSILASDGLLNKGLLAIGIAGPDWLAKYGTAMTSVITIESWMWSGFTMFIFIAGLQAIPRDYYESAEIEGASKLLQFFKITLPLLIPSFTVVITLNITGGLRVFDIIYVLTNGGPGFDTQVMNTYTFRAFSLGLLGESSASAIVLAVVIVSISFLFNRYLKGKEVEM